MGQNVLRTLISLSFYTLGPQIVEFQGWSVGPARPTTLDPPPPGGWRATRARVRAKRDYPSGQGGQTLSLQQVCFIGGRINSCNSNNFISVYISVYKLYIIVIPTQNGFSSCLGGLYLLPTVRLAQQAKVVVFFTTPTICEP